MKQVMEHMEKILFKIENYNKTINKIKSILGEDYKEFVKYFMIYGVYYEQEQKSIYDKIILSLGTYYNGWFDTINLTKSFKYDSSKQIYTFNDLQRTLLNDYTSEYGSCYKTGILDEDKFLDLVIKIIEKKLIQMHQFSLNLFDSIHNNVGNNNEITKLLSTQNNNDKLCTFIKLSKDNMEDIECFTNIFYKLISLKNNFEYTNIENRINNLSEKDKTSLDILISVLKVYTINPEQLEFMNKMFHPDIVSNIKQSMDNYDLIDIYGNTNNNDNKKLVK